MHLSKTIRCSAPSDEQTLAVLSRTANFTQSICQQMCLFSVSLSTVNLEVTAVEKRDGCRAQLALRSSDIL